MAQVASIFGITRTSALLCLAIVWSCQLGEAADTSNFNNAPPQMVNTKITFAAAKPQLDTTPTVRIKPFTLGTSEVYIPTTIQTGAQTNAPGNPLRMDTNFIIDPIDNHPLSGEADSNRFNLQTSQAMRLLAKYNVQLLVDRSRSMGKKDCPGGISRWRWCGRQAANLAQTISPLAPRGLTMVPFATAFHVFENASAENLETLFQTMKLQLGTRLYEPLAEQFDTYFNDHTANKKPLLLVVITDGRPSPKFEPELVRQELVAASNRQKKPGEVTVIFCQIGAEDAEGQAYLQDLDQHLGAYGARFAIVHTIAFEDLQQQGLGPALASTLQRYAPAPAPEPIVAAPGQTLKTSPSGQAHNHATHLTRRSGV